MADPAMKPVLQKPPGYRDPSTAPRPAPRPQLRKPVLPPSFHPKKERRSMCRLCCCCLCTTILLLILLILAAGALFYLWFDPKLPTFYLESLQVPQFDVSSKQDGSFLTAQTVTRVQIKNPNGVLVYYYGDTEVDVNVGNGADETGLGSDKLPGFKQGAKNTTRLKVETHVKNQPIDDSLAKKLAAKVKSKDLVVSVGAKTEVGLGVFGLKLGMLAINLQCGDMSLDKIDSTLPRCTVNTLRWINIR